MNKKTEVIYAELDGIFDTRAGTIARLSQEAALAVLLSGYHEREIDEFAGVDMEAYRDLYQKRDVETLKHSGVTNVVSLISDMVRAIAAKAIVHPLLKGAKVVINTYPYKLGSEELVELGKAVEARIRPLASEELNPTSYTPIEFIHMSPEELTPQFCKQEQYAMMLVYEYDSWMSLHTKAFEHTRLADVVMIAPAIYYNQLPSESEMDDLKKNAAHPLHAVEILAKPLIDLQLIPVEHFSVIQRPQ